MTSGNNNCPVCGQEGFKIAAHTRQEDDVPSFYCKSCDIAYLDHLQRARDEESFYNKWYPNMHKAKGAAPSKNIQEMYELSKKFLSNDKKVLEIGSAECDFLNSIKSSVGTVTGCDLSAEHCAIGLQKHGINSINADIRDLDSGEKYDIIFMFQLFEHIAEPHAFLKKLKDLLIEEGILIVCVPNLNEALYGLYELEEVKKKFFFKLQHQLIYSEKGLNKVMRLNGFENIELVKCQNYSITNHLNWIYLSKGNSSFETGMECRFDNLLDGKYLEVWNKLNRYYKDILVDMGYSDTIFGAYRLLGAS